MSGAGWFADVPHRDDDEPEMLRDKWQPCLETGKGMIPCFDVWFATKEECETFIRDEITPIAGTLLP